MNTLGLLLLLGLCDRGSLDERQVFQLWEKG
jgi:hypothetical protein